MDYNDNFCLENNPFLMYYNRLHSTILDYIDIKNTKIIMHF